MSEPTQTPTCGTCRHYLKTADLRQGACIEGPPAVVIMAQAGRQVPVSVYPPVGKGALACSRHSPRESGE